jgi:preprotein translocase subunit SecE
LGFKSLLACQTLGLTGAIERKMAIEIYKKGQAAVTRYAAAGSCAAMLAWGCYSLFKAIYLPGWWRANLVTIPGLQLVISPALLIALGVFVAAGFGIFLLLNRPSTADLLIDTEQEMKKVSWPTRQEAWNSSVVVMVTVLVFTVLLFVFDVVLARALQLVSLG